MEVVHGWSHRAFEIPDSSGIDEALRFCARTIEDWKWSEADGGRLSQIVTELGSTMVQRAHQGELWVAARPDVREVEIISLDKGPGIMDVARAIQNDVSSNSDSPGNGLATIRQLASDFDIHSTPEGTACLVRVRAAAQATQTPRLWGAVSLAAPGEEVCGDGWAVAQGKDRLAAVIADGLGHGPHAAVASSEALKVFALDPTVPLDVLVQQCHTSLQTTRGAALFALQMEASGRLQYTGAGNVMGRIISGLFDRSMITQHGTVGVQVRKPEVTTLELPDHAVAVMYSDGIASRWKAEEVVPLLQRDATLIAAILLWKLSLKRDDATVLVVKQGDALDR